MHIRLEKFTASDFQHYFSLVHNEEVMKMITERAIPKEEATKDFEKLLHNNALQSNFGSFKIIEAATNQFVGLAKLSLIHPQDTEAELGYMLLPSFWGKGIASHVTKMLMAIAQQQPQIKTLTAIIDPQNLPSRKILLKNGFISKELKEMDGLPGEILVCKL